MSAAVQNSLSNLTRTAAAATTPTPSGVDTMKASTGELSLETRIKRLNVGLSVLYGVVFISTIYMLYKNGTFDGLFSDKDKDKKPAAASDTSKSSNSK